MFVSVYTIAKNEEQVAGRLYDCFKEADEVCVLVNNSTDRAADILRGLGAKVVEKAYKEFRFDVARNEAMKMCSNKADLLFVCDMDDVIEKGWKKKVERAWALGQDGERKPNSILFTNPRSDVAKKMKEEIEGYISEGRKPPLPPKEIPRCRIEIPELA